MDCRVVGLATKGLQTKLADWDAAVQLHKVDTALYTLRLVTLQRCPM
jgi:hypothetical protein